MRFPGLGEGVCALLPAPFNSPSVPALAPEIKGQTSGGDSSDFTDRGSFRFLFLSAPICILCAGGFMLLPALVLLCAGRADGKNVLACLTAEGIIGGSGTVLLPAPLGSFGVLSCAPPGSFCAPICAPLALLCTSICLSRKDFERFSRNVCLAPS